MMSATVGTTRPVRAPRLLAVSAALLLLLGVVLEMRVAGMGGESGDLPSAVPRPTPTRPVAAPKSDRVPGR